VVRGLDEGPVVLDDDDRVASVGELPTQLGQLRDVAGVESDGRLVQDVEGADQLGAELRRERDALSLAARERPHLALDGEVAEAHTPEERDLGGEAAQHLAPHLRLPRGERELVEPAGEVVDGQASDLGDAASRHRDGKRLGLETGPVARGAGDLAPVAREEDPHVELVAVALDLLEEAPDAAEVLVALVHPAPHGLG
jgi:hypothetical protein